MKTIIISILYTLISFLDYIDYHYVRKEHLIDNYKTIEEVNLSNIEILTDTGYKELSHLMISKPFEQYIIKLENGYELNCADEHILFDRNFNEVYAKDLNIGDYVQTDQGIKKIISIDINKSKVSMCDAPADLYISGWSPDAATVRTRGFDTGVIGNHLSTGSLVVWYARQYCAPRAISASCKSNLNSPLNIMFKHIILKTCVVNINVNKRLDFSMYLVNNTPCTAPLEVVRHKNNYAIKRIKNGN